jgi:acyl-CoA reductase-like NAD-dependent aldehyde dehydrogenase
MSSLQVRAAYDESLLETLETQDRAAAERALQRAFELYSDRRQWLSPERRILVLERLAQLIAERESELTLRAAREGGKPLKDSLAEIRRAVSGVQAAKETIPRLVGREIPMNLNPASRGRWANTYREPRGVAFAISAFNHPFNLLIHQVVTAFAAGCPVVVKPAAATPLSAVSLVDLMKKAGAPEGWVQLIIVENEVTQELVGDPRVAFMNFIGSSKVGWMLRSKLAPGATCVMEHGGVAPVIIDDTADLDDAVPLLTKGGFYHAGQVCVSVQRIYAHEAIVGRLCEKMKAAAEQLTVGDPADENTDVGPLIRRAEVTRVAQWVSEAVDGGAKLLLGGKPQGATTFQPTLLFDPPDDAKVSTEEIFGPVVCIYSYSDIDDAIRRANLEGAYFQASLFTNRLDVALDVGKRLHGTSVMVNDHTAFRVDWMPFGGHRDSGAGIGGIESSMLDMTIERMIIFRTV